jgi:deoxyguanosine kinase
MIHIDHISYQYIAIEGNIGAGKTTLSRKLAEDLNSRLILEEFAENPFLPHFYKNQERYAFPVELFFLSERHKQLQEHFKSMEIFQHRTVADYYFLKSVLFARQTLGDEEYRLFQRLYQSLQMNFPKPDLIIFLHRSVPNLLANIRKRNREYEQNISEAYLDRISSAYFEYFKVESEIPIVLLNANELDFVGNPESYALVLELIQEHHRPGVNHVSYLR